MQRLIAILCIFLFSSIALAHHSRAPYNSEQEISVKGTVTKVLWRNPHPYYKIESVNAQGVKENWQFEGFAVSAYVKVGWRKDTVQVGDAVTMIGNPNNKNVSRTPEKQSGLLLRIIQADGNVLDANPAEDAPKVEGDEEAERESEYSDKIMNTPGTHDFSGNWHFFVNNEEGKTGGFDPPRHWPLSAKGQDQVNNFVLKDDPFYKCINFGHPRLVFWVWARNWVRFENRIEVETEMSAENQSRTIWLDGRKKPADFVPSDIGFSTGTIDENGTLIVETTGYASTPWGNIIGLDSSAQKRVVVRYNLTNGSPLTGHTRMVFEMVVEDSVYLSTPVKTWGAYDLAPAHQYVPFSCDPEASSAHLEYE
ncbi:MAG: DUF6152 family protein [Halioglobus sp.]|nr:DUF6152 family protein [Halioglobus sp.]